MIVQISQSKEAQEKQKAGIDAAVNLVKTTLGPKGKYVSLYNGADSYPTVTNDGVTILKRLQFENPFEDMGLQFVQEASNKTNDSTGDGTTTAAILCQAIIEHAPEALAEGSSRVGLVNDLHHYSKMVLDEVKKEVVTIDSPEMLARVATISSRDKEVGKIVADLVHELGSESYITVEDFPMEALIPEKTVGMKVRSQLLSPFFFTNKEMQEAVMENVPVLVLDQPLSLPKDEVLRIMETVVAHLSKKHAIVIAPGFGDLAMQAIVMNWNAGQFKLLPIQVTVMGRIGEGYVRDIAAVTGGEFITRKDGFDLTKLDPDWFGEADRIVATFDNLYITGGKGDVESRIKEVQAQIPNLKDYEADGARERVAKMKHALGTIKVGSSTDSERETRKFLVEDAINASRVALRDGVVAGGGAALYRASHVLNGIDNPAARILRQVCSEPMHQIAHNCEIKIDLDSLGQLSQPGMTLDFTENKIVSALEAGIIDPYGVVEATLTNAVSMACNFILSDGAVVPVFSEE